MFRFLWRGAIYLGLLVLVIAAFLYACFLAVGEVMAQSPTAKWAICQYGPEFLCPEPLVVERDIGERPDIAGLKTRNAELERIFNRMAQIEAAAQSFTVFHENTEGPMRVTSGHRYSSMLTEGAVLGAYCYVMVTDETGLDLKVDIANMNAQFELSVLPVSDAAMAQLGLSEADQDALLPYCTWPRRAA